MTLKQLERKCLEMQSKVRQYRNSGSLSGRLKYKYYLVKYEEAIEELVEAKEAAGHDLSSYYEKFPPKGKHNSDV